MSVNLRDKLRQYIALNNYVSAYRTNVVAGQELNNSELDLTDAIHDGLEDLTLYGASKTVSTEYLDTVNANGNSLMQGRDLPLEYTQIDGAVKKGTAGIQGKFNTGVKPTADDVKIEMKVKIGDEAQVSGTGMTTGSFYACQARINATGSNTEITGISGSQQNNSINGMQYGQSVAIPTETLIRKTGHVYFISYEYKNGTHSIYAKDLTDNIEASATGTYTFTAPSRNLFIFGNSTTGNNLNENNVVYYCRIWESGELIFDGVSVIRNSDNAVGIYDYVTKTFIEPIVGTGGGFESNGDAKPVPDNPMDIYDNNGILTPYLDAEGSSSQARIPTPTAPIDMINYKQGLVELRKVGTVKDTLTHGSTNATITRNVGVKVFDGTEDFSLVSGYTDIFRTPNNAVYPSDFASNPDSNVGLCNNYKVLSTSTSLVSNIQDGEMGWNTNGALTVRDSRFTTAAQFKAWLAQMYIEGTPVVLYYPLATATTESILPAYGAQITRDYEQLEYITTDGSAYIKTDVEGTNVRWVGSGQATSVGDSSLCLISCYITGTNGGSIANYFVGPRVITNQHWSINTGTGISTVPTLDYAEYDVSFYNNGSCGRINNEFVTYTPASVSGWTFKDWYIGHAFGANGDYLYIGNIYEQKAYKNGVLVGDFIPAKRKSDGVIGMYDAVSGTFYTNVGTGDFTAGPSMYRNLVSVNDIIDKTYGGITLSIDKVSGEITTTGYKTASAAYTQLTYDLSKPLTAGTYTLSLYNSETMPDSLVGFAIDGAVSTRTCSFATATNNTSTFTIAEGSVATQLAIRIQGFQNDPTHQFKFKIQLEKGSTATSYINSTLYHKYIPSTNPETLKDANNYIATCTDLFKLDNVKDIQEVKSGFVSRNCRVLVLDGTEGGNNSWRKHSSYAGFFFLIEDGSVFPFDFPTSPSCMVYCTDYKATLMVTTSGQGIFTGAGTAAKRLVIIDSINFDSSKTATDFKKWLKERYYEDNPIIVVYQAGTSTKYDIDPNDCTIGKYIADGGVETSNAANYFCGTYFPVLPNTSYTMKVKSPVWSFNIAEYDSTKTFIQRTLDPTPHGNKTELTITTSSTTRFIRVGNNTSPDGGVSNPTTLEKIQELSPVIINNNPPYVNEKPQLMKKAPVEITQTALADATINTTNRTASEASPEYPLDIACNNGLVQYNRVYTGKWKLIKNPTQQTNKAIYIKVTNSTWTALGDRGAGAVIPLRVGDTYKITFNYNSLMYNDFIRYGEVDDSTPPVGQYKPVYNLQAVSPITNDFTYTFTAGHPYLAIQATASTVENGRLEEAFVIENITSSLPGPVISPLAYTGYEELEYIEGTTTGSNGSYINTLIKPNSNTKVEVKFALTGDTSVNQCLIGGRNQSSGDSRNSFGIWANVGGKMRYDFQSGNVMQTGSAIGSTDHIVIKDGRYNTLDGAADTANDEETFTCNYNMLLFSMNSGTTGAINAMAGKVYYCKIWDNDVLVRDFIPVKRVSDNAIGMYDRVSKTFFANSGSGDFVGGPSKGILQNTETAYVNSKNLYNYSTTTLDYEIQADGTIAVKSGYCYSDIIPVVEGNTYTFSMEKSNAQTIRIHGYIDDTWNQQITSKTTSSNSAAYITFTIPAGINGIRISQNKANTYVQVEEGPRPTRYEVYGRNIIKPIDLWSTYQYLDAQNISTGNLTRNVGVMIFDGTEDWTWTDNANAPIRLQIAELAYVNADTVAPIICSHFDSTYWNNLNATTKYTPYIAMNATTQASSKRIVFTAAWNPSMLSIDTWKAWLAEQYNHGTPLMIIYPRLTPTDGNVYEDEDFVLTSSNSKIERDSEYINNLGIGVNYKKLK